MKWISVGLAAASCSSGLCDRIFDTPVATVLERGVLRIEYGQPFHTNRVNRQWLQYGIDDHLEIGATREDFNTDPRVSLNLAYNLIPALSERFPGIGFGVRDLLNRTSEGRFTYVAFTYAAPMENGAAWERDFLLTIGVGYGGYSGPFVNAELPLTNNFSLQAEHDGRRITAGLQWQPAKGLGLRLYMERDRPHWGITFQHRL